MNKETEERIKREAAEYARKRVDSTMIVDHTDFSDAMVDNMRFMDCCASYEAARLLAEKEIEALQNELEIITNDRNGLMKINAIHRGTIQRLHDKYESTKPTLKEGE